MQYQRFICTWYSNIFNFWLKKLLFRIKNSIVQFDYWRKKIQRLDGWIFSASSILSECQMKKSTESESDVFFKFWVKLFKFTSCGKKGNFHLKHLPLLGLFFCWAGGRAAHWVAHLTNRFYSGYPDYCNHYPINYLSCPTFFLSHH